MLFHVAREPGGVPVQSTPNPPRRDRMKRLFALLLVAAFSMTHLVGCNTVAGAGKDVQKVGEKVEEKAEDCKDAKC